METMRTAGARRPGHSPEIAERAVPEGDRRPCLLLIEDDDAVRRALQLLLQGQGYDVRAFASGRSALADAATAEARYLVADYMLADGDGIDLLAALRRDGWSGGAVLITAFSSPDVRAAAARAGFVTVLDKPFRDDDLLRALRG
jgi:CheY-like chemotaxis protein